MQTIEFTAEIKDGVVHIPNKYRHLQQQKDSIFDKFQIDFSRFKFDRKYANKR